jgi:cytoskeletal protein RodZ
MDRSLLNVKFDKSIKLKKFKKSEYDPEKTFTKRTESKLYQNLWKLAYFLGLLFILVFGTKLAVEYTICYVRDEPHKDITQIFADFKEIYKESDHDK